MNLFASRVIQFFLIESKSKSQTFLVLHKTKFKFEQLNLSDNFETKTFGLKFQMKNCAGPTVTNANEQICHF